MTAPSLCLIGGSGRSGTTILKDTLFRHPDVAGLGHSRILTDPDGIVDFFDTCVRGWSPYVYDVKFRRLAGLLRAAGHTRLWKRILHKLNRWSFPLGCPYIVSPPYAHASIARDSPGYFQLVDGLLEQLTTFRYRGYWGGSHLLQPSTLAYRSPGAVTDLAALLGDFVRHVAADVVRAKAAHHFVEDSPWNLLHFDRLLQLLPEARLVHIYRDPRDAVASYMNQTWAPSDPLQATRFYLDVMERWRVVRGAIPPESYLEVALERFVAEPEGTLREICRFWGIAWDDVLLTTDRGHSHAGRWRQDLPQAVQPEIQRLLQPHVDALGYR